MYQTTEGHFFLLINDRSVAVVSLTRESWALSPPPSPRQRPCWQTAYRYFATLKMEGELSESRWLWSHSDSPQQSTDTDSQYAVPCKPVEQNRHCYSAWLLSTESPQSPSDTKPAAVSHRTPLQPNTHRHSGY